MTDAVGDGFAEWVLARRPSLLRTAYLLTGDPHEAEDLVQASLERVVPQWRRLGPDPEPYVRRVIVTTNISRWRRRRWREQLGLSVPDPVTAASDDQVVLGDALSTALLQLSPRQRAAVVLRFYDDLSERETADLMDVSVGTVKSHTRDALARLRQLVPDLGLDPR